MRTSKLIGWSSALALCLGATQLPAQDTNEVEVLRRQLKEATENFDKVVKEQRQIIDSLNQRLDAVQTALSNQQKQATASATTNPPPAAVSPEQFKQLSDTVDQVVESQKKERPNEFNPSIGFVGESIFSYRSKGSDLTGSDRPGGFDAFQRSMELNVAASVDPFAKGWAVFNATADAATGEATVGIEEAALQTTSLPGNLTLTAGRFFGEFGRLAYIHDHELPFVNRPLVLEEYIGGESRTDGLQLNWLPPINHYLSLTLGVGDQFGEDPNNPGAFRSAGNLNVWGRLSTYFELSPAWQLEGGVSGLWNPDADDRGGVLVQPDGGTLTERARRVAGLDMRLSYVPLQNNQFRSFVWGMELLYSNNRYFSDPDGSLNPANPGGFPFFPGLSGDESYRNVGALGLYSYATYKWSRRWSAGFQFDWVQNAGNHDDVTCAYSPYVTLALSHWNQLRLQYTHTDHNAVSGLHPDDAIYLQWMWIIGSHSHGWVAR